MSRRKQARPIRVLEDEENPTGAATAENAAAPISGSQTGTATTATPAASDTKSPQADDDDQVAARLSPSPPAQQTAEDEQDLPEVLMCQRCQEQFTDVQEYLTHKEECDKKAIKHDDPAHSDPEDMVVSEDDEEEEDDDGNGKRLERMRRHRQDAANNNNNSVGDENSPSGENSPRLGFPFPLAPAAAAAAAPGHVTLEALQNTKVAVAQFAATAMANNTDNEAALQELAVLQSTLFTLQHQQVLQLQLINQLQQQLQIDRTKEEETTASSPHPSVDHEDNVEPMAADSPPPISQPLPSSREPTPAALPPSLMHTPIPPSMASATTPSASAADQPLASKTPDVSVPSSLPPQIQPPMCSISSSLASTIITHNNEPPSLDAPNTLEMLQKRAQEVLDNASQGLLATNLADELAFRKSKGSMSPYDSKGRNEPFFKHRCRYCGKVFGSDSALQIHIRSHTGERPYKCNVCGSRFTTKGNLKVHFQRHSAKFPHIKMNPNPVPEHLDKYHPPLLAQLGQQPSLSPGAPPHPPHLGFPNGPPFPPSSLSLFRPQGPPGPPPDLINNRLQLSPLRLQEPPPPQRLFPTHPMFLKREDHHPQHQHQQETPENLSSKHQQRSRPSSPHPPHSQHQEAKSSDLENASEKVKEESKSQINIPQITPKQEPTDPAENEAEQEQERYSSPIPYDECSNDSKFSNEEMMERNSISAGDNENMQDEPENLSHRSNSISIPLSISTGQRLPANFSFGHSSPPSSASSGSLGHFPINPMADITKDPAIYTNLLPRPGSNDNSWESLIEVTKTSETSKLQQLVDNIEHKLSDPNQCVICHRVLSCKSALQMHYRTHTGERPFKCKICGRAFTTKGNLKTHMGVHRAKPPMRVLHQCPVCHKKFTNALVLQQHIRLHTGEPTDLTPEQIQAAEVKDFPSPGAGFPGLNSMHPFLGQGFHSVPGLSPLGPGGLPLNMKFHDRDGRSENESMDEDDDDDDMMSEHHNMPPFPASSPSSDLIMGNNPLAGRMPPFGANLNCSPEDLCSNRATSSASPNLMQNGEKSPGRQSGITSPEGSSEMRCSSPNRVSTPVQIPRPPSSQQAGSPTPSECNSMGALDLTPRNNSTSSSQHQPTITSPGPSPGAPPPSLFSTFGLLPPGQGSSPLMSSALSSLTSSVLTSTSFSPLRLAVGPAGNLIGRGNTTCNLCFKTFACNSALEIHYRSHTKERPFKCTVCDRGFSTKGNMKQHMLTHKIRDMPQHMFDKQSSSLNSTATNSGDEKSPMRETSSDGEMLRQSPQLVVPAAPPPAQQPIAAVPPLSVKEPPTNSLHAQLPSAPPSQPPEVQRDSKPEPIKREPTETELPLPKRPPTGLQQQQQQAATASNSNSKHLCHVCNKNFSSSSALQIHMRTHTGDKPFRCTVCQKAFTTKGNLKVHMGTHMWSNGASRRGRRMSLDLPPIPMTPKDSEFLQRRPDLFYPYLPAPFLNGMQQKLNEMSSTPLSQNGLSGPVKYSSLLGFGYPPPDAIRSQTSSPDRPERAPSREPDGARGLWDLHFDRKPSVADPPRDDLLSASREGLAA